MSSITTNQLTLTEAQVQAYHEDGFHVERGLLTPAEVDEIRTTFMDQTPDGPVDGLSEIKPDYAQDDPLRRWPRMLHPHRHDDKPVGPISMKYMLHQRIGQVLHDLFGEPALAAQSMFYFKPPGARGQDLHQDNLYLRIRPGTCMAAWVAIDRADRDNGGMVVVPGSHRLDVLCPDYGASDLKRFFTGHHVDVPDDMSEKPVDLDPGDVLFFNGSVIHGSYPNTSTDRFRRSFICHYAPKSCDEAAKFYHPMYDFDGNVATRALAQGGGPCGDEEAASAH